MNAHFFGAKRAYYATLRIARPVLAKVGLTPARFDLMTLLLRAYDGRAYQSALRKAVGVARSTVSRMLRSLEKLGFIVRERSKFERRQLEVRLTAEGRARAQTIHDDVIDGGYSDLAVDVALGGERWFDEGHCLVEKDTADWVFRRMRNTYGDFATLYYPWHPDD